MTAIIPTPITTEAPPLERAAPRQIAPFPATAAAWPWHHLALGAVLALAALLNLWGLNREGYANTYYAAAVKSMLTSWHNFFYLSFDAGGFVSVDKSPLGLWVQAASAKLFGFSGLSLLLPEALAGVLACAVLYHLVARAWGRSAGLVAALALAVTPISVVTDRNNTIDSLLILTLLLGAWAVSRAAETGRLRLLLLGAVLVGLGFNIKMLQAYLVVPAFGLVYLLGAPRRWPVRLGHLALALLALLVVSLSWAVAVDLTPTGARPFVSDSGTNSELSLILGYNGLGRVTTALAPFLKTLPFLHVTIDFNIVPGFAPGIGTPGPLRLLSASIGGQASWLLPLALLGLLGAALGVRWRLPLDRRGQALALWGGWLGGGGAFFSTARFFHLYYLSMLAPPVAALAGIGLVALWRAHRAALAGGAWRLRWRGWLLPVTLAATAATQARLLAPYDGWSGWLVPLIVGVCLLAATVFGAALLGLAVEIAPTTLLRAGQRAALAATVSGLLALLTAPTAWAAASVANNNGAAWLPQAGPAQVAFGAGPPGGGGAAGPGRSAVGAGGPGGPAGTGGGGEQGPFGAGQSGRAPSGGRPAGARPGGAGSTFAGFGGGQGALTFSGDVAGVLDPRLLRYLEAQRGTTPYLVATTTASYASLFILETNEPALALGGYQGWGRIVTPAGLARLVANGTVRFFYLPANDTDAGAGAGIGVGAPGSGAGGPGTPGGAGAASAVAERLAHTNDDLPHWVRARCTAVPASRWQTGSGGGSSSRSNARAGTAANADGGSMQLYDCAGATRR